jgi:hypothetical protein
LRHISVRDGEWTEDPTLRAAPLQLLESPAVTVGNLVGELRDRRVLRRAVLQLDDVADRLAEQARRERVAHGELAHDGADGRRVRDQVVEWWSGGRLKRDRHADSHAARRLDRSRDPETPGQLEVVEHHDVVVGRLANRPERQL